MKNHYKTLNLKEDASQWQIKMAFRIASNMYHPDKPGGSEKLQAEINEAYSILGDPEKRKAYDNGDQKQISLSIGDLIEQVIKDAFIEIIKSNFQEINIFETAQNIIKVKIIELKQERQKVQDNIDHVRDRIITLKYLKKERIKENMNIFAEVIDEEIIKLDELISNNFIGKLDKDILVQEEALKIVIEYYPLESEYHIGIDWGWD